MNYFCPGSVNTHWGPGPVYTNWGPEPVARARAGGQAKGRGPSKGPGAKQRAGGQEIQIPVTIHIFKILLKNINFASNNIFEDF